MSIQFKKKKPTKIQSRHLNYFQNKNAQGTD